MKKIFKTIILFSKKILDRIIGEEAERVNEFNRHILSAKLNEGGEG